MPQVLPLFTGVSVYLPPFQPSYGPTGLYDDCKGSEADGPHKWNQNSPIPGRLADQGPFTGGGTSEHSDSGRPDTFLRVDNQSREVRTQTPQVFSFMGHEYHLDSALLKLTHERWLKLPALKVETCFDCKMFDLTNWVARLNGGDGPGGTPSHEPFQFYLKEHWRYPVIGQPPSLVRDHFSSPRVVAKACKHDEGCRPSPQRPQYPNLYKTPQTKVGALT